MFIGREKELQFLNQRYESPNSELIVLYGRRRVGKTETLREFSQGKDHVFYSCIECTDSQQLNSFSSRVLQKDIPASKYITTFSDWEQAFSSITELKDTDKKLLIIDEFPYMVKANRTIPSILQNLWDLKLKDENVMIILCGSAMSFIEKEILAEKNPLYGRATGILKMNEMDFYDAIRFFPDYSALDKIRTYGILGGIPHYLKQFDSQKSVGENICRNVLQRGSILYSEVEFLMRQELRETTVYNTIIEAIALGNTRLNDISQKTQIERSKLMAYLKNLMNLGIIEREFSVTDSVKEQANTHRGLYKITDPFFRFWYAFVFPNMSELEAGDFEGVYKYIVEPQLEEFISYVFEDVCRQYLRRENQRGHLPFHFSQIGRWWNKTDEIDVMAVNRERTAFMVGECKFKNRAFELSEFEHTREKFTPSRKDADIYYFLFSKSGFSPKIEKNDSAVYLIDLDTITAE